MKKVFLRLTMVLALVATLSYGCGSATSSLASVLGGAPQLSGVSSLLKGAGGIGSLLGDAKAPFTLLAPSNDALSKLGGDAIQNLLKPENKAALTNVLKRHIIPGKLDANALAAGNLKDASGNALNLGGLKLGDVLSSKTGNIFPIDQIIK
jgi:uncharacterized surface protein with fasciclin (FAS1) repeats